MSVDFKTRQIRVNQIINSGSTSTSPLLLYGMNSVTDEVGGYVASHFAATGSDTWLFVSGTIGSKNSASRGVATFGGDVVISGTIYNAAGTAYSTGGGGGTSNWNELSPSPRLNSTASVAIAGALGSSYAAQSSGADVFFFVSGTSGIAGTSARKSVFGGDVVTSGSHYVIGNVTGTNAQFSGDVAVNGGNITTTSAGTATLFNTSATTVNIAGGATSGTTVGNATGGVTLQGSATVSGNLQINGNAIKASGGTTALTLTSGNLTGSNLQLSGDVAVNGGNITSTAATVNIVNTTPTTVNIANNASNLYLGKSGANRVVIQGNLLLNGNEIQASGGATGLTFPTGNASAQFAADLTVVGDLAVNGGDITTTQSAATIFPTNVSSLSLASAASTVSVGGSSSSTAFTLNVAASRTGNSTLNLGTGAVSTGNTKSVNIGQGGNSGSTTNIRLGTTDTAGTSNIFMSGSVYITGSVGMKGSIIPDAHNTYTLGTPDIRWAHIYTGDLHLRNERGDWTVIEENDFLRIVNNKTGKNYKMMMQLIDD